MKKILKQLYLLCLKFLIPNNRFGDNFVAFIIFVRAHRRLPTHQLILNDVLFRIKITDEIIDPLRVFVSDKEYVKLFVKAIAGDQFNVPTNKVLHSIDEVKNYQFPSDCCIKPTHLCGEVILRRKNSVVDLEKINRWFASSHYHVNREANYKYLKPKVIVEPLIFDSNNLNDYKFLCYNGKPKLIQVDVDRCQDHVRNYYDPEWNKMPFTLVSNSARQVEVEKPKNLEKMLAVATSLSAYFNLVRIDLYSNGEECFVGEITNSHGNACEKFTPKSAEMIASNMIFGKNQ